MIVHFGIQSLDALGFVQKHLSQPFRRHLGVIRVQGQCFLVGLLDELICPVIQGHRRVEAAEHHRLAATAYRLHYRAYKIFTGQLGKFLEPYPPKEALCRLDGLDLAVIVQPSKDDLCACRKVGAAHRGHSAGPQVRHAQRVNSPLVCANTDSRNVLPHRRNTTAEPVPVGSFWMPSTISNDTKDDLQEPRPSGRL